MTTRDIYACLLRCHPSRFRARFADEMLATFEDAMRERSSAAPIAGASPGTGERKTLCYLLRTVSRWVRST